MTLRSDYMNTTLRETLKTIDDRLFAGLLKKLHKKKMEYQFNLFEKIRSNKVKNNFSNNINILFNNENQDFLGRLFDKHGSNRGYCLKNNPTDTSERTIREGHRFNDFYSLIYGLHKDNVKQVLECGIGTKNTLINNNMSWCNHSIPGGSLRAWRDYFPNANVIGIDIDPDVMFTEDRIKTFVCDQTSKSSINSFIQQANLQPNTIDIIIDDGFTNFVAIVTLFENTKHLLRDQGLYIIEDFEATLKKYIDYFSNLEGYCVKFVKVFFHYIIIITKNNRM
jgi:hypothetical protein